MSRSATGEAPCIEPRLACVLALFLLAADLAAAQVYRIDTLVGDFDPLEEVPLAEAWVGSPNAVAVDSEGSLYFVDGDTYRVRKVDASGRVSTVAGSGLIGFDGDGGPATAARLGARVQGLALDRSGNVYIADTDHRRIRRVDSSGTITTIAGTGRFGGIGDGGAATRAAITAVYGLAADASGNLYIADTWNDSVRRIDSRGVITTVAGTGEEGRSGDGGPATEARLDKPRGVAVDDAGNLYVADTNNHRVRRVDPGGTITTVAGTGEGGYSGDGGPATEAQLSGPYAVAADSAGNVYIADSQNALVRKVGPDGTITTVAGGAGGPHIGFPRSLAAGPAGELYIADSYLDSILLLGEDGTVSTFVGLGQPDVDQPGGAAIDSDGNAFVADTSGNRILKIDAAGVAVTVAGTGESGYSGDGGLAMDAEFSFPQDVALGADGVIYVADTLNNRIRKIDSAGTVTTVAGTGESGYGGDGGPASDAVFDSPAAVAVGDDGALYVVDENNHRIRKVDSTGTVTTIAGDGQAAEGQEGVLATQSPLGQVPDVAVDSQGRVYLPERDSNRVLGVDLSGLLMVVAGRGEFGDIGDGGPATNALLQRPSGVAVSDSDALYIADTWNHTVRRVNSDGIIETIAGSGIRGYDGDGTPAKQFGLYRPAAVAASSDETVLVIDSGNRRIRILTAEAARPEITSILNAASLGPGVAPGSVAVLRGKNLAPGISAATVLPPSVALPTALLQTSVTVADRTEASWARRTAGLYSVSPSEIRIQIPERAAAGLARFSVNRGGSISQALASQITRVAPGLFSANGDGVGVAVATAVRIASDGTRTVLEANEFDAVRGRYVAVPIDISGDPDPVHITLFGTGFRGGTGTPEVRIAGQPVAVRSSGPARGFHGVDELVVGPIPGSVRGPSLDVVATVDGRASNAVTIAVK